VALSSRRRKPGEKNQPAIQTDERAELPARVVPAVVALQRQEQEEAKPVARGPAELVLEHRHDLG